MTTGQTQVIKGSSALKILMPHSVINHSQPPGHMAQKQITLQGPMVSPAPHLDLSRCLVLKTGCQLCSSSPASAPHLSRLGCSLDPAGTSSFTPSVFICSLGSPFPGCSMDGFLSSSQPWPPRLLVLPLNPCTTDCQRA